MGGEQEGGEQERKETRREQEGGVRDGGWTISREVSQPRMRTEKSSSRDPADGIEKSLQIMSTISVLSMKQGS